MTIIPKAGKIKIWTSGCPKNQSECWYKIGSPPPEGSKKEVLKFLSVNNIVIAAANTGKDNNNETAVTKTIKQIMELNPYVILELSCLK